MGKCSFWLSVPVYLSRATITEDTSGSSRGCLIHYVVLKFHLYALVDDSTGGSVKLLCKESSGGCVLLSLWLVPPCIFEVSQACLLEL